MWTIKYYATPSGHEPATKFKSKLNPREEIPFVELKIKMLSKLGYKLDRPHSGYLENNLYELIAKTQYGEIRLLYFFNKSEIVITHGIRKKTQKTPPDEIKRARNYRKKYLNRGK